MLEIIPLSALAEHNNYIWLIKNKVNNCIAIVDPGEASPLLKKIETEKLRPVAILITHHHWDHVNGITAIINEFDIPVYTPKTETVIGSTHPVTEGDLIRLNELGMELSILNVPGHTSGAIAYYNDEMVFSGDTLFSAGCGRVFEGTPTQMYTSLSKFKHLPDKTRLYCGHEYTLANLQFASTVEADNKVIQNRLAEVQTLRHNNLVTLPSTLSLEKQINPFLRCEIDSVIDAANRVLNEVLMKPDEVFATLRQWKDNFKPHK